MAQAKNQAKPQTTAKPKAKATTRTDAISTTIADQILQLVTRGVLSPGVHLGQTELAERFKASRVPVREALKLLSADGIVVHDPNRGFFIATLSSDEARQLYRLRHLIEAELLHTIEWPNKAQLADLKTRLKELEKLVETDRFEWATRHRDFHKAVFDLSREKVLVSEALRLWILTDRYRSLLPLPQMDARSANGASDEHHLINALATRDRDLLLKVFEQDRTRIEKLLIGILEARGL